MTPRSKLKPVLDSAWWMIGPTPPELDDNLPGPDVESAGLGSDDVIARKENNAPVDHHLFRNTDGSYHLWGCIRATKVGRILYHWKTDDFTNTPWECTGEFFRCDHNAGECLEDWNSDEWLQSPYFVNHEGRWYMFYGGHGTGGTASDGCNYDIHSMPGQMCLMTSPDGENWTRHKGDHGYSRVFAGPGEVRDPCLVRIDDIWYCYYAGFANGDQAQPGFFCRTSQDLIHWSDYKLVYQDMNISPGKWGTECPHVVARGGFYYLFSTQSYRQAMTHVYRSTDPLDFGIGDASANHVCDIAVAAPEIYEMTDGKEYVSSNHDPDGGTMMARIRWIADEE